MDSYRLRLIRQLYCLRVSRRVESNCFTKVSCLAVLLLVKSAMFKFGCRYEVQVSVETCWRFYNHSCPRAWTQQVHYCSEGNLIFRICLRRLNLSLCRLSHLLNSFYTTRRVNLKFTPLIS